MYPTSIKEDEEYLKCVNEFDKDNDKNNDKTLRNCIIFRIEQKKVLKEMVDIGKIISQSVKVQAEVPKYQACIDYVKSMLEPWC
jgi:hypothetical protein